MAFFLKFNLFSPEQPRVVRQLLPLGQAQGFPLRHVQEGLVGRGCRAGLEERQDEGDEHRRDGDGDLDRCHRSIGFVLFLFASREK